MTRSEQQHNNKPQRKRSQGSVSPVRAPGLPGTLVWDAQTPPKPPGKRIPPLEPQGKGRTPQKSLSQRDSRCHPSPSLPRSRAALPRDHFLGNTCRGRCRCSFNRPQHRLAPNRDPEGDGSTSRSPQARHKPPCKHNPEHGCAAPHPRGALGPLLPRQGPSRRLPTPARRTAPHRAPHTRGARRHRGARGQHQRCLIPPISRGDPA